MTEVYLDTSLGDSTSTSTPNTEVSQTGGTTSYEGILEAARLLKIASAYLTIVVATFGNSLSLAVMCRKSMRGTSSTFYLAAIAVADIGSVYFGQVPALAFHHGSSWMTTANSWNCSLWWFWLFNWTDVAVWLVLALTVDRFIAVWLPHHVKQLCTVRRAVMVTCGLVCLALLKNFIIIVSSTITEDPETGLPSCAYHDHLRHFMVYVRPWLAFTLYAFAPIILVFLLNLLIIYRLVKMKKATQTQVAPLAVPPPALPTSTTSSSTSAQKQKKTKVFSSMNAMFLSVSIVFLILLTPSILHYATVAYWVDTPKDEAVATLLTSVFELLAYGNHSINFFLYCLTGRRFRREFLALLGLNSHQEDESSRIGRTLAT